jgi:hypothetical protein
VERISGGEIQYGTRVERICPGDTALNNKVERTSGGEIQHGIIRVESLW